MIHDLIPTPNTLPQFGAHRTGVTPRTRALERARPMSAPRPRRSVCFRSQPGASRLPAPIAELIAGDDPALHVVLQAVLDAQLAGQDITDPAVLAACVAAGREHVQRSQPAA